MYRASVPFLSLLLATEDSLLKYELFLLLCCFYFNFKIFLILNGPDFLGFISHEEQEIFLFSSVHTGCVPTVQGY
jgi:hypothetical protein